MPIGHPLGDPGTYIYIYVQIADGCREYILYLQYLRSRDQRKFSHAKGKEAPSRDKDLLILLKEQCFGPSAGTWLGEISSHVPQN